MYKAEEPEGAAPVIAILGPTGSGKSTLGLSIALRFGGEIVNCDSVQVYRGMNIGSAKASPEEQALVPHHLLDIINPHEELTAGAYSGLAREAIREISARGGLPVVVGGTGFYLRALFDGLAPAPGRDEKLRTRLVQAVERRPEFLSRFLRRYDPQTANRIHANDRQKLIRAVEIACLAGKPASATLAADRDRFHGFRVLKIGLAPNRQLLYERLNSRSAAMFRNGVLEETRILLGEGAEPDSKPLQTLGYRQAVKVLRDGVPIEQAMAECQLRTRQYAKRQMTWFRKEPDIGWLQGFGTDIAVQNEAVEGVGRFLAKFNSGQPVRPSTETSRTG